MPEIVYRDDDLLVVNKPAGLPTTSPSSTEPSLVRWVEERTSGLFLHPTSRLDSPVTGLVTFALNKAANRELLEARRRGEYERRYVGITLHGLDEAEGRWSWPISIDPRSAKKRAAGPGRGAREACTVYAVQARASAGVMLRLIPKTGRTHQLRVHAARAGVPLFGDHAYGGERRLSLPDGSVVTARRAMLHCARVGFPWKSGFLRHDAPIPSDMARVWIALGGRAADFEAS